MENLPNREDHREDRLSGSEDKVDGWEFWDNDNGKIIKVNGWNMH